MDRPARMRWVGVPLRSHHRCRVASPGRIWRMRGPAAPPRPPPRRIATQGHSGDSERGEDAARRRRALPPDRREAGRGRSTHHRAARSASPWKREKAYMYRF